METKKKLQRLTRIELLELLLEQTAENELLREKLNRAESMLAERHLKLTEAGNLAEAVLAVNDVMEAAQAAAQQYIDNARDLQAETQERCARILAQAEEDARKMRYEAMLGEDLAAEMLQPEKESE